MKIIISSTGTSKTAKVDMRFGRAAYFMIYDEENDAWDVAGNRQNLEAVQGAGIQAAQNVSQLGAAVLITGNVGPKAYKVLAANKVKMYSSQQLTVEEAYEAFKNGRLTELKEATVEGHWG